MWVPCKQSKLAFMFLKLILYSNTTIAGRIILLKVVIAIVVHHQHVFEQEQSLDIQTFINTNQKAQSVPGILFPNHNIGLTILKCYKRILLVPKKIVVGEEQNGEIRTSKRDSKKDALSVQTFYIYYSSSMVLCALSFTILFTRDL